MNFKSILGAALIAVLALGCSSCGQKRTVSAAYSQIPFETTVMNYGPDGTVVLKAWGSGSNRAQAVDNAVKQAVSDVLFKGFSYGPRVGSAGIPKLVGAVNAQQKFAYYFNPFFTQGGEYLKYGWEDTSNKKSVTETENNGRVGTGIIVVVDRPALQQRLIADGIIKP